MWDGTMNERTPSAACGDPCGGVFSSSVFWKNRAIGGDLVISVNLLQNRFHRLC